MKRIISRSFRTVATLTALLTWLGSSGSLLGQLQWSSYDSSGNLIAANVASGGDATYGQSAQFNVPAGQALMFVTESFAPFNLTNANAVAKLNFSMSADGGLNTGSPTRVLGMALYNDPGTPSNLLDDSGYRCDFNTGNSPPDFEMFYHPSGDTVFFSYDSGHKLGTGAVKTGAPTNGIVYGMQLQLNVNSSDSGISMGTSSSTFNAAGAAMTNGSGAVFQTAYTSVNPFTTLPTTNFNEFSFMFRNTTTNNVILTLSGLNLVPLNPGISTNPADFNGNPGTTATFTVDLNTNSAAPLSYQWYEIAGGVTNALTDGTTVNGSVISGSSTTGSTDWSNTLTIANAQIADSGYVFCVVSNSYGVGISRPALLNVANDSAPVFLSISPTNADLSAGQGTNVTVRAEGVPAPTYYWYDNNNQLLQSGSDQVLTLSNLQFADAGTYTVAASNSVGVAATNFTIGIYVAPCISQGPTNMLVNLGDPVTFSVTEGGCANPAPTFQWYFNGNPITGATNASYSIASANWNNIGSYSVTLSNPGGAISSAAAKLAIYSTSLTGSPMSPASNATGICYDTPLYLTFNQTPFVGSSGQIRIYNVTNTTTPVDTIDLSLNNSRGVQARSPFPGDGQSFNYYPVMIHGTTVAIYPHSGVLTSNQTYFVTIDPGVILDSTNAYWGGISNSATWQFTTKPAGPANPTNLMVSADNSGDFDTVQGAVDSVPLGNTTPTLINIRDGNYVEIVDVASKNNITFLGQSRSGTVVGYPNNANIAPGGTTHARMAFKVDANDIAVENLTISNSTPQGGSQAEALMIESNAKRCIIDGCDIDSRQDTILANVNSSQAYFYNSTIAGNFDYIWGGGNLFFQDCQFHTLSGSSGFNLTAARTDTSTSYSSATPWVNPNGTTYSANGFSFVHCIYTADAGVANVTLAGNNGTAGGLDSWVNCLFDTSAYVTPTSTLSNSYVFWQNQNTALDGTTPVSVANVQSIGVTNNDPRLLAVTNVTTWLYGWTPQLLPSITAQPVGATVNGGQSVSFNVGATGVPDPTYQWMKDGTNLVGQTGPVLTIASVSGLDAGTYSVVVANAAGSLTSSNAVLTVNPPTTPSTISSPAVDGSGNVQFTINGAPGSAGFDYRVWATTNIALTPITSTWMLVTNGIFNGGPVVITDATAVGLPQRFYIITVP